MKIRVKNDFVKTGIWSTRLGFREFVAYLANNLLDAS